MDARRHSSLFLRTSLRITLNGETKEIEEGTTLLALVEQLKLAPERLAIELNPDVVRRDQWPAGKISGRAPPRPRPRRDRPLRRRRLNRIQLRPILCGLCAFFASLRLSLTDLTAKTRRR